MLCNTLRPLTFWNPWRDFEYFNNHLNHYFGGKTTMNKENQNQDKVSTCNSADLRLYTPRIGIWENDNAVFLAAEMPGVSEKDVTIDLQGKTLEITGTVDFNLPEGFQEDNATTCKRKYTRQFTLNDGIDQNEIAATMKDGVLRLTLAKVKAAVPRRIEVKSA